MKNTISVICLSFFVLLLLLGCKKSSSEWIEFKKDETGSVLLFKKVNVDKDKGNYIIELESKKVLSDKGREEYIKFRNSSTKYEKLSYLVSRIKIDCFKKKHSLGRLTLYDRDGNIIESSPDDYDDYGWVDNVDGGGAREIQNNFCDKTIVEKKKDSEPSSKLFSKLFSKLSGKPDEETMKGIIQNIQGGSHFQPYKWEKFEVTNSFNKKYFDENYYCIEVNMKFTVKEISSEPRDSKNYRYCFVKRGNSWYGKEGWLEL